MSKNLDDYIQQGVHGQKETKPDERRKFLGTLRERIVIALTQPQVREEGVYPQVEEALKQNPKAHLYLNGNMNYSYLSKYIKAATKHHIEYTLVTNKKHNSAIGLVLAHDYAIDKEEIFVKRKGIQADKKDPVKKGVMGLLTKVFRKRG